MMNENGIRSLSFDFKWEEEKFTTICVWIDLERILETAYTQIQNEREKINTNGHSKDGQIKTHAHELIHKSDAFGMALLKQQQIVYYYVLFYLALAFFSHSLSLPCLTHNLL